MILAKNERFKCTSALTRRARKTGSFGKLFAITDSWKEICNFPYVAAFYRRRRKNSAGVEIAIVRDHSGKVEKPEEYWNNYMETAIEIEYSNDFDSRNINARYILERCN